MNILGKIIIAAYLLVSIIIILLVNNDIKNIERYIDEHIQINTKNYMKNNHGTRRTMRKMWSRMLSLTKGSRRSFGMR